MINLKGTYVTPAEAKTFVREYCGQERRGINDVLVSVLVRELPDGRLVEAEQRGAVTRWRLRFKPDPEKDAKRRERLVRYDDPISRRNLDENRRAAILHNLKDVTQ